MESRRDDAINIIIPVYNEGENITNTLDEINSKVKTPYRIYVVYDFDEDNTLPVVKDYMQKFPYIELEKNRFGRGVLNAIKTGFEVAPCGAVLVVMADLSDDLAKVDRMHDLIKEEQKRHSMAREGRRRILDKFSARRMAERYEEVYQKNVFAHGRNKTR